MIFMEIHNLETGDFSGIQDNKTSDKEVEKDNDHDISFLYSVQDNEFGRTLKKTVSIEQTEAILDAIVVGYIKKRDSRLELSRDTCEETVETLQHIGFKVSEVNDKYYVDRHTEKALACIKKRYSMKGLSNTDLKEECKCIIAWLEKIFEEEKYATFEHIVKEGFYYKIEGLEKTLEEVRYKECVHSIEAEWCINHKGEQLSYPIVAAQIEEYLATYGIKCSIIPFINSPRIDITWYL